jgi:hypothetical protein
MTKFVNLTPHTLNILTRELATDVEFSLTPSGEVARVASANTWAGDVGGIPTYTTTYGEVTGLPAPSAGVVLIVSGMVAAALRRYDVMSPGDLVRDEAGRPIGCRGLRRSVSEAGSLTLDQKARLEAF